MQTVKVQNFFNEHEKITLLFYFRWQLTQMVLPSSKLQLGKKVETFRGFSLLYVPTLN